jgi:histone H3/H4
MSPTKAIMSPTKAPSTPGAASDTKEDNAKQPGDTPGDTNDTPQPQQQQPNNITNKGPPSAVEFEPPLACVRRILKTSLPNSTNVGKDASAAFARASGIFIIYLTACANDFARENRRQTITANDVLAAIKVSSIIRI